MPLQDFQSAAPVELQVLEDGIRREVACYKGKTCSVAFRRQAEVQRRVILGRIGQPRERTQLRVSEPFRGLERQDPSFVFESRMMESTYDNRVADNPFGFNLDVHVTLTHPLRYQVGLSQAVPHKLGRRMDGDGLRE